MEATKRCPYCAEEILAAAIKCKHCGSSLEASQPSSLDEQPSTRKRSGVIRPIFGALALTAAAIWYFNSPSAPSTPTTLTVATESTPTPDVTPATSTPISVASIPAIVEVPPLETRLIEIVSKSQQELRSAENDMQKGGIKNGRDKSICSVITNFAVKNWIGTVKAISANSDGKGVIELEIAKDVLLKTWNNDLSDFSDHTLIDPNNSVFQTASLLKPGQSVKFSGSFFAGSDGDCIEESSITLDGKLRQPEFIFRFAAIGDLTMPTTEKISSDSPGTIAPDSPVTPPTSTTAAEPIGTVLRQKHVIAAAVPLSVSTVTEDSVPPPTTNPVDNLTTVRNVSPQAADHIANFCKQDAGGDENRESLCRSHEVSAWQRLVPGHEFPNITQAIIDKCQQPPFPDTFVAREACAKYELNAGVN